MLSVPLELTTTYQHAFDERMNLLIPKYVHEGMDGVAANNKARFEAKAYAHEVVRRIVIANEAQKDSANTPRRYATPLAIT